MSHHVVRAARVVSPVLSELWESNVTNWGPEARDIVRALDAAGLLVTPAHDAAVAAKALRDAAADGAGWIDAATYLFLQGRADRIEREGGSDVR